MKAVGWIVLVACGSSQNQPDSLRQPGSDSGSAAPIGPIAPGSGALTDTKKCLPVVSNECGCVYSCGVGERRGDAWFVKHTFWKDSELKAKFEAWCVDNQCTDAFAVEIVCDSKCPRKPADPTCHFDGAGTCVGRPST